MCLVGRSTAYAIKEDSLVFRVRNWKVTVTPGVGTIGWKRSVGEWQETQKVHFAQVESKLRSPNRDLK